MGFSVRLREDAVVVELSGWDRATSLRGRVVVPLADVSDVRIDSRNALEALIDHRSVGIGTHLGREHPNRRRVGTMLGRGVPGNQFWAVAAGDATRPLLVIDLIPRRGFRRLVLDVDDPSGMATALSAPHSP